MELDDWDLSAEELDSLERDAINSISQRSASSSSSTTTSTSSCLPATSNSYRQQHSAPFHRQHQRSTVKTVDILPAGSKRDPKLPESGIKGSIIKLMYLPVYSVCGCHLLLLSIISLASGDGLKEQPKIVKFFLHSTGNIAAKFPYDTFLIGVFRKIPKASWYANDRIWMFPISSLLSAEKLLTEVSGHNIEVESLEPMVRRSIAIAATVPDLRDKYDRIPNDIESRLLPFQRDGVRFILQHGGRVLLADEMGLGKTLQAIAVTTCVSEAWPVLVLAPSSLRLQWASMIQEWLHIPSSDILVVLSNGNGSNKAGFKIVQPSAKSTICLDGIFNIISYDIVAKLQNFLTTADFKVVIADESHFLKNAQAKRTSACLPILQKAQYAILLSGTPALSRPIELFTQLEALYPSVYKNVHEYGSRYCKGGVFGMYQGASNHEELHNLMKATVMIRRLKKDVLTELPVKRRQQVFLDMAEKDMKNINALFRELEVVKNKIKACQSEKESDSLQLSQKNLINKIYTDSAEAKIPAVLDYLGTVIEADCKFLIFAHHQPMIQAIHEFLLKKKVGCIRIDGGTPASTRQSLVTDFQNKDNVKAAVLSIKAGGVGLTLTAASTVIFAELSWTPGDLIQAEDRAHRIGQVSSVNVYYLLANDTVDDIIWDVVQSKLENLGQMLDGEEDTMKVSGTEETKSSPAKQWGRMVRSSPSKQKTLDSFMNRCSSMDDSEHDRNLKYQRK
ncbi:LOW QUALITY PROTEIN: SWI/SNF-related matrix-associated actin-dependent regulator of chromatin subfamily A-like protein 1 [Impatiens glandulifera]|uniref:LOW QUALITY PROTEIN: SWI/SNF-related matrix-associated actin-dependent regulator of chromatin subfamily A-like protein 1 n=1 Tax=Impatiens glandulifera TaxID=253017 RepID=UPI001FB199AE|nr:LOW QUALITY PROTEIN: SWI/SNF-related matrix-associated actin-dependent regulator of chromatin subfamily A-like protein 1 [Impatiens glandulifera]